MELTVSSSGSVRNEARISTSKLQAGLGDCADNPIGKCCYGDDPKFTGVPTEWSHSLEVHLRGRRCLAATYVGGRPQQREKSRPDADERDRMLATIDEMNEMIGTTLAFARDEVRAEPRRRVDLAALLGSAIDDMADAGLPVTMAPAAPIIQECQPGALKRAVNNLLDNAVKYGKRAEAAIKTTGKAVEITIDDNGPGIPEAELSHVFEPFYRVEESRNRDSGGTGLGLAIVQAIVQAHAGELTLANRPGGGLRACITLPV